MKRYLTKTLFIIFLFTTISISQDKGFGLGIMIGEPTGFSSKYWLDETHALDFGLAYSFVHTNKVFSFHADYIFHAQSTFINKHQFPVYYGFGARIHFGNKDGNTLGARGVIGLLWMLQSIPLDTFIEVAPVFNLFPETSLHLDLAIGARYFF